MVLGGDEPASRALRARAQSSWVPLVRGGASLEQPIDADDVVSAMVAALDRPELAGRGLDLAGPESLPRRDLVLRAGAIRRSPPRCSASSSTTTRSTPRPPPARSASR
jgi:uncharacterized protein YbjT (DUF2867 family)